MDRGGEIYLRYLSGDDGAFGELVREYYDGLVYYVNTYVGNVTEAEDVAEDVLFRLAAKRPRYTGKASFKTWLYTIARNASLDWLRSRARRETLPLDDAESVPFDAEIDGHVLREETRDAVRRAMGRLSADYRQALWLTWYEEMSVSEVADVMKRSVSSAEHILRRAKESLGRELMKEGIDL